MQNEALGLLEDHCFEDSWLKGEHMGNLAAAEQWKPTALME